MILKKNFLSKLLVVGAIGLSPFHSYAGPVVGSDVRYMSCIEVQNPLQDDVLLTVRNETNPLGVSDINTTKYNIKQGFSGKVCPGYILVSDNSPAANYFLSWDINRISDDKLLDSFSTTFNLDTPVGSMIWDIDEKGECAANTGTRGVYLDHYGDSSCGKITTGVGDMMQAVFVTNL